jgi:hypothetical protein
MTNPDRMRYALQLEMLERNAALGDAQAIELLLSEFALAQNAGRFDAVSGADIDLDVISRSTPQEGVTRYAVDMYVDERSSDLDDATAIALLRRAFVDALNASFFLRVCVDDLSVRLIARAPVDATASLRFAA